MKFIFSLIFLFIFLNSKAESYALLIGISEYPEDSGWSSLSSYNDLIHIEETLKLNGFRTVRIKKIEDELATHDAILDHFQRLIDSVKEGDVVYVHFSGHGQQVLDDDSDEIDGLDEAIVPYDSPKDFKRKVYEGEKLIRDDVLQGFSLTLRRKLGRSGQLIIVLDSCNSGTGVRGQQDVLTRVRGTSKIMASDSKLLRLKKKRVDKDKWMNTYKDKTIAPIAIYYSTEAKELNYETYDAQLNPIGSLSFAIATILGEAKGAMTFQELYERIVLHIHILSPKQHPQWEGNAENIVFKNSAKSIAGNFHPISKQLDSVSIQIEVGSLSGIFEGSKIELYSLDEQRIVQTGYVKKANLTNSIIELDNNYKPYIGDLHKIKIASRSLGSFDLAIRLDIDSDAFWIDVIEDIRTQEFIKVSECNADLYLESNKNLLTLKNIDGSTLFECSKVSCKNDLMNRILEFGHAKFLKSCITQNTDLQFSIEVLQSDCSKPAIISKSLRSISKPNVKVGDCIQILIKNVGSSAAYFTLLDIQPDDKVNLILPYQYSSKRKEDLYLEPNQEYLTDFIIDVGEPLGKETLKLIATDKPISLSSIVDDADSNTRGQKNTSSLMQLFSQQSSIKPTEYSNSNQSNFENIGIATYIFEIVE